MATKEEQIQAEEQLSAALYMVVQAFKGLGFDNDHILRITNLVCEEFINKEGKFTEEYIALAKQAIDMRNKPDEPSQIILI